MQCEEHVHQPCRHAIWVPPRHRHALRSHGAFEGFSVYVAEQACAALPRESCAIRCTSLLREAIARAASWTDAPSSAPRRRVVDLIFDEIRETPQEPIGLPLPSDVRLQRVASALLDDLSDQRGLAEWARFGALSARTLTRRFVIETGFTFAEWRQQARLMRAVEMLAAGTSVTTVALSLGYDNVSAFIAMFRRVRGVTPARFLQALQIQFKLRRPDEEDVDVVRAKRAEQLMSAPRFSEIVVATTGEMARRDTIHPAAFLPMKKAPQVSRPAGLLAWWVVQGLNL